MDALPKEPEEHALCVPSLVENRVLDNPKTGLWTKRHRCGTLNTLGAKAVDATAVI